MGSSSKYLTIGLVFGMIIGCVIGVVMHPHIMSFTSWLTTIFDEGSFAGAVSNFANKMVPY